MTLFETGQVVTTCGIAQAMGDDYSFLLSVRGAWRGTAGATGGTSARTVGR